MLAFVVVVAVLEELVTSRSKSLGSMHTKSLAAMSPSQKRRFPPKPAIVSRALPGEVWEEGNRRQRKGRKRKGDSEASTRLGNRRRLMGR